MRRSGFLAVALILVLGAACQRHDPEGVELKFRTLPSDARGVSPRFLAQLAAGDAERLHGFVRLAEPPGPNLRGLLAAQGIALRFEVEHPIWVAQVARDTAESGQLPALVAWVGAIRPQDKVSADLRRRRRTPQWARAGGGLLRLSVEFFADVPAAETEALLAGVAARIDPWGIRNGYHVLAPRSALVTLASDDAVQWIEPGPLPYLPLNNFTRRATGVEEVQELDLGPGGAGLAVYRGLTGEGVQVGVWDGGIDPSHEDFRLHDPAGVEIGDRLLRRSVLADDHGTWVAGVVAGDGIRSTACGTSSYLRRGMAPGAELLSFYPSPRFGPAVHEFAEGIADFGMDLSNHSYAQGTNGIYGAMSRRIDELVRGTVTSDGVTLPGRPQIWASGNNGLFPEYFSAEGFFAALAPAKNSISVGAVIADTAGFRDHLARFSSLGPTWDGRIKPEIVAPGSGINTPDPGGCYTVVDGTSFSSPAAAGIGALALQQYAETYRADLDSEAPLPSTLKATLVQSAADLVHTASDLLDWTNPDTSAAVLYDVGPDGATGYGRVDARAAVGVVTERILREGAIADPAEVITYRVQVPPLRDRIQFTLAWDDPPDEDTFAADTTPRLVNDLELSVVSPDGSERLPWVLSPLTPAAILGAPDPILPADITPAGRGHDHRNNLEQVTVDAPSPAGEWLVRVSVAQDTLPLLDDPQRFSLAGDFHGRIHFCDWNEQPGSVYVIRNGAPEPIFTEPDPLALVYHSAFSPGGVLYVSDANTNAVLEVQPGEQPVEAYRHTTFLRDVAFDPAGAFYFSEASGVTDDGAIYKLDLGAGTATLAYKVVLSEIGGRWAGDFAFDPSGILYLSTGNSIGGRIYRVDDLTGIVPPVEVYSLPGESVTGIAFDRDGQLFFTNWDGDRGYIWRLFLADGSRDLVYSFADRFIWDVSFR